jgi:RNA polymerase sigma-70 factor (ECF subfamily)
MDENLDHLSDEDLMAFYQTGDARAFDALYERHSGRVLAFLQKKTSAESARDLLQETFLKVHRSRHQYSTQYPFLPWLFAITRNALVDFVRLNETKVAHKSVSGLETPSPSNDTVAAWTPDLSAALQTLPASQRRAIELRYLSDWTFEQIADHMKTTPGNVRQVISRGIKKLRSGVGGSRE